MRIEKEAEAVSASRNHLVFAYYVTGHGFGHATRVIEGWRFRMKLNYRGIFGFI